MTPRFLRTTRWGMLVLSLLAGASCRPRSSEEVIVYAALDREFSAPILEQFTSETGLETRGVYDVESTKTVGLVNRILQERSRPRCDVFWNNEILHTLRLEKEGVLDTYLSPVMEGIPVEYRSPEGYWTGFAARARVLLVNRELLGEAPLPDSILSLVDPQWQGKVGVARPLFGTTATHAAVLFSTWGDERTMEYFQKLKQNAVVLAGNKQVALAVGRGELVFGLTDTDDAIIELEEGRPVEIVFPDQQADELGTLYIPNTLAILKNSPNPGQARKLVDYLLRPEVELALEKGASAQFPVRPELRGGNRLVPGESGEKLRWMEVDFSAAADKWMLVAEQLHELFDQQP